MKKMIKQIIKQTTFVLFICLGAALNAQEVSYEVYFDVYYHVTAPLGSAVRYSKEMEQRFAAYNKLFCFDPALLPSPLRVRIFSDKAEYDSYVTSRLGTAKPGAVYLHYGNPANRELVIHHGSEDEARLVPHQAFVQFLRAFIPDPPHWLREGFAAYFSSLAFDRTKETLVFEENLEWLETARRLYVNPELVLLTGASSNMEAASWSLASFFMANKTGDYYRALTDSFTRLSPQASAEENSQTVYKRLVLFSPIAVLTGDYAAYMAGKRTFAGLIEEGQKAYNARNFGIAGELFNQAAEQKSGDFTPWYYLGLLAYEEKKYNEAEEFYQKALLYGAERAQVQYVRGVNAAAAGKRTEAIAFLEEASSSAEYKSRSEDLLKRLR